MRTMFFEMLLLNDASQVDNTSFIWNGKEWGERKTEAERERVKGRVWLGKSCSVGHKLDPIGQVFMRAYRRDNLRVYQDGNKAYPKNF
jgi:hypothetical protein